MSAANLCSVCGADISHKRRNADTCSRRCRTAKCRAGHEGHRSHAEKRNAILWAQRRTDAAPREETEARLRLVARQNALQPSYGGMRRRAA